MLYKVTIEPQYLKAELFNRETMEETREFLRIVADAAMKHQRSWVLICVISSNPVFTVERSGFLAYFRRLATDPSHKIALLGDSEELGISHQYIELIGRQHGVNVPDPEPGGGIQLRMNKGSEAKVAAAQKACQQYAPGGGNKGTTSVSGGDHK